MKKSILLIGIFIIMSTFVKADPPKKVLLNYDKTSGILKISAIHKVKDVNDHFIDQIKISVNDKDFKTLEYKKQTSNASHDIEVSIPNLKTGSKIEVKARCNEFGSKKAELEVQ